MYDDSPISLLIVWKEHITNTLLVKRAALERTIHTHVDTHNKKAKRERK